LLRMVAIGIATLMATRAARGAPFADMAVQIPHGGPAFCGAMPLRTIRSPTCLQAVDSEADQIAGAAALLSRWDAADRARRRAGGAPGGLAAPGAIDRADELRAAARTLAGPDLTVLRLGVMADDGPSALRALQSWIGSLPLRGQTWRAENVSAVDVDNRPADLAEVAAGPVYIKYTYTASAIDPSTGREMPCEGAYMKPYAGRGRGVLFNPALLDGEMRMFGDLPLALFEGEGAE